MGFPRLAFAFAFASLAACADDFAPSAQVEAQSLPLRPDDDVADGGLLGPLFEPGSTVERHDSSAGNFRVHFVRTGAHAVPAFDGDRSGTPDYVEETALEYERVLTFYRGQGFLAPVSDEAVSDGNGGDGRFDVYLLNFPTSADGSYRSEQCPTPPARGCAGYMLQENDFNGRSYASLRDATRILASHELFHAVQYAYVSDVSVVLSEATAVWASEHYDPRLNDFEGFVPGYLARPERSLLQVPTGPPDGFSYGAALWFRQLELSYDEALVPRLWDEIAQSNAATDRWGEALARVLSRDYQASLDVAFARFARWNLYTAGRADPTASYPEGARYPLVGELAVALPFYDDLLRLLPLSAHYFAASSSGERVHAAVAAAVSGQRVLLANERAGRIVDIVEAPAAQGASLAGLAPGDRVHLVLIDARAAGSTVRVRVCLGDENALAPCATTSSDAGVAGDAGVNSDAGSARGPDGAAAPADGGAADTDLPAAPVDGGPARSEDSGAPAQPGRDAGSARDPDVAPDAAAATLDDDPTAQDTMDDDAEYERGESAVAVRERDSGCSIQPAAPRRALSWLVLPLACFLRLRRARSKSP